MRIFITLIVFVMLSSVHSYGQTATNYANCSAVDGALVSHEYFGPANSLNQVSSFTVTDIQDTDLIELSITIDGAALGQVSTLVGAGANTIFSEIFTSRETSTASYDPVGDQSALEFTFTSDFVDTGSGLEMFAAYAISCSPGAATADVTDDPETASVVTAFLGERNRRLLDERPERARMVRKRLDALWGDASSDEQDGSDDLNVSSFWATPNRLRAHVDLGDFTKTHPADIPDILIGEIPMPPTETQGAGCWDAWAEVHYAGYQDAGDREGDFLVGYVGVDCQIHPAIMVGLLGQVDWMDDEIGSVTAQTEGVGWMVGPYATARLAPNLFFDFRAAWGQSDNETNVGGVSGSFETSRWLVDGQLTGNFRLGDVRISPQVSLSYVQERQDAYIDSTNVAVPAQTVSLGRVRFGPEISRRYLLDSGTIIEPHLALRGIWDFDGTDVTIAGVDYNIEGLRGAAEIGVIIQRPDDFNIRISAKYDGIGLSDYHAYGGQVWVNIPLH